MVNHGLQVIHVFSTVHTGAPVPSGGGAGEGTEEEETRVGANS